MPRKTFEQSKPMSTLNWPMDHHIPLEGASSMEGRLLMHEYTWGSLPTEGFLASHDRAEDNDGVETVYFSHLWVETSEVTWPVTGTTSTVQRLIIEDLEALTFHPERHQYAPRRERALAAEMFGRLAVPRLAAMGIWKQAHQLRAGDVVRASENHEYEQPRTVTAVSTDHSDRHWGPRMKVTWEQDGVRLDNSLGELAWVVLVNDQ